MIKRKILSEEEKTIVRKRSPECFICGEKLKDNDIVEYDHIRSLKRGGTNDLSNFASVHRSCHRGKGTRDLEEYKEDRRLKEVFGRYKEFKDICKDPQPFVFKIDEEKGIINFEEKIIPLWRCPNTKLCYFYYPIPKEFLASDTEVQPRPLEQSRLYKLAKHLRENFQLSPSVARLVTKDNKFLLFDGQHKAAAQILGNNAERVDCKVFINPPLRMVHKIVEEAHDEYGLRQQSFKTSIIARKFAEIYRKEIEKWKELHPGIQPSEKSILIDQMGYSSGKAKKFINYTISDNILNDEDCAMAGYVSEGREKDYPMTRNMFNKYLLKHLIREKPLEVGLETPENFRREEHENLRTILNLIAVYSLNERWNPRNPESEFHKIAVNIYKEIPFRYLTFLLAETISFIVRQRIEEGVCYRKPFDEDERRRIETVCDRLFNHALWKDPYYQATFKTKDINEVDSLFKRYSVDARYLDKP